MLEAAITTKARREFTPSEIETHAKTYRTVTSEFSLKAFARAFWQVMSNETDFPSAALIRRYIVAEAGNIQPTQASRNCGKCTDGWVVAYWKAAGKTKQRMPVMRRCECKGGKKVDWDEQGKGYHA